MIKLDNQELNTDLFDRYLRRELTDADKAAFDEKLLNDKVFNAEFIEHKTFALGISDFGKAELKNYIKTYATVTAPANKFPFQKMLYAMAAVFILFAGVYVVMNYYIQPNNKSEIAISNAVTKETDIQQTREDSNIIALQETGENEEKTAPAVGAVQSEPPPESNMEDIPAKSDDMVSAGGKGADVSLSESAKDGEGSYSVLSDKKIGDTILLAMNIIEKIETPSARNASMDKESTAKKSIPGYNNNNYNKAETVTSNDTTDIFKKKALINKPDNYTLEFWQSPVNFKGYKMTAKTIQLYGISGKVNLFTYNNKLYLRSGTNVYLMTPCTEGCSYKTETDQSTLNLILKQ